MRALIGLAVEKFGRIDCLFNNAGGPAQTGGIEGLEVARFDAAMATLVRSVMLGMKHAAPHMRRQGSGSIINNGSIAGRLAGFSSSMVYGAAKAAVIHLTKCVAMELGESGIRVNSISPGAIATGIFGKALGLSVEAAEKTPDVMREVYKTAQPIQRAGLPEDIAHAAVFLASDESSFINGHDLVVDWRHHRRPQLDPATGLCRLRKAFDQGAGSRPRRGGINVRNIWYVAGADLRPVILYGHDGRYCLRLRDRQGIAAHDGRHLGDRCAAVRGRRSRGIGARYRRADCLVRFAECAGQAGHDRARVLWPRRIYPRAPARGLGHRLRHQGRDPLAACRRSRRDVQGGSSSSSRPAQRIWFRQMRATPSLRS